MKDEQENVLSESVNAKCDESWARSQQDTSMDLYGGEPDVEQGQRAEAS